METDVLTQANSERHALTANQRAILRYLMGYSRGEGNSRPKTKTRAQACPFIRKTLFEGENNDEIEDEVFRFKGPHKNIDLKNYALFPSLTKTDEKSVIEVLIKVLDYQTVLIFFSKN